MGGNKKFSIRQNAGTKAYKKKLT